MIKLFKNDFASARKNSDPNIATIAYNGFIQQLPNETFFCKAENISFAGSVQVDLIDCSGVVFQNVDGNFYYSEVGTDLYFEFGNFGINKQTPFHLLITDLTNDNKYYSNSFIVTNYRSNLSARFDFKNKLDAYYQSIRLSNTFEHTPENKKEFNEYTETSGKIVKYKSTTTYQRKWIIDAIDFSLCDYLNELFDYDFVYLNGNRVVISDYKSNERKGDTNYLSAEFLINLQNESYNWQYQLYEGLNIISVSPDFNSIFSVSQIGSGALNNNTTITFNKQISYNGNDAILKRISDGLELPLYFSFVSGNVLEFFPCDAGSQLSSLSDPKGVWSIIVTSLNSNNDEFNGFAQGEWVFEILDGEFSSTDFDNNEFLTT